MHQAFLCLLVIIVFIPGIFPCYAKGASPESFRTPEYLAGNGLDAIRAAEAYALGYSGKGVTIGVLDTNALPSHPEFAAKNPYPVEYFTTPNQNEAHGIHTAGTIAASKDGYGMHGVAWDANLVSMIGIGGDKFNPFYVTSELEAMRAFYKKYPQVGIINNSWGLPCVYLNKYPWPYTPSRVMVDDMANVMAPMALKNDVLFIYSSGNDAQVSPKAPAALPSVILGAQIIGKEDIEPHNFKKLTSEQKRALSLNILSAMAFDPFVANTDSLAFIASFSNLSDGASSYSILAPGVDIYSSVLGDGYKMDDGTSMAAPHVSGVAALIKEAFPYMGGKQIADVLLSTASPLQERQGLPPFLIQMSKGNDLYFNILATKNLNSGDLEGHEAELRRIYEARYGHNSTIMSWENFIEKLKKAMDEPAIQDITNWGKHIITQKQYEGLFGVGILDAYKAVLGPGHFDANRLENADLRQYSGLNYAMYPVDTKGYDSLWANDIGQVKATNPDAAYTGELAGLNVGLRKSGQGMLYMSGQNTYLGPTVVEAGGISLGVSGTGPRASLAGSAIVESGGFFTGNGRIKGNLFFQGTVLPGLEGVPGSSLRVGKDVSGSGTLLLRVTPDGKPNRLVAGGTVELGGMKFRMIEGELSGGAPVPLKGYKFISAGNVVGSANGASIQIRQGSTLAHTLELRNTGKTLLAGYEHGNTLPQAKALSEGFLAGMAVVNQGADLVSGQGMDNAMNAVDEAASAETSSAYGFAPFAVVSGGYSRYDSGSHIDVNSFSLMTGLSSSRGTTPGRITLGAFFEYGSGGYNTDNSFGNSASVSGDGNTSYVGGGILGRFDFQNTGPGHFYAEASGRAGNVRNRYYNGDLRDSWGRAADYESLTPYYGMHAGAGYIFEFGGAASLNLYGKWLWTHQEGESLNLSTGERLRFSSIDSQRLRAGGRFAYAVNKYVTPYAGAAYEHEFNGKSRARSNGFDIGAPDLRGDTGIGELGVILKPSERFPLSLALNAQGYVGKRQGVSGGLQIKFEF